MIDEYPASFEKYDNVEIRIFLRRVPRRFKPEYEQIIQSVADFTLGQFVGWKPPENTSPVIVTIKPEEATP